MLNIEILEPGKNVTLGKGLLRILQNEHSPKVDLLVREALQNSLDAAKEGSKSIDVEFIVQDFDNGKFAQHLELVGDELENRFKSKERFIAIRDFGTVGLTGPLTHGDVKGQKWGNFVKLVYDLAKPQEQTGAGGSWGYGKTIFYRMGIGLVIYYSRILLDTGHHQERLAIAMVENEDDPKSIIPPYRGSTKSGVAWWGVTDGVNSTRPVTNRDDIHKILDVFGIRPYQLNETGTTIIIPYIDEQDAISHNEITANNLIPSSEIYSSLSTYLEYSVQRWYAPRLNNFKYKFGNKKYLKVKINNEVLDPSSQHPYFRILQDMYNYGVEGTKNIISYIDDPKKIKREVINSRSTQGLRIDKSEVGYLVFGTFSYDELNMDRPTEAVNPHFLSNLEEQSTDQNSTIITYCRQPGMLVSYENKGEWAHNLPVSNKDEYIIALFVLNSNNKITFTGMDKTMSLDEYVRQGENADHISWSDHQLNLYNPKLIDRIQKNVNSKLKSEFEELINEKPMDNDSRLARRAGDLILPPQGFGKKARKIQKSSTNAGMVRSTATCRTTIFSDDIVYKNDGVEIPIRFQIIGNGVEDILVDLELKQDSVSMSLNKFEQELFKKSPIYIKSIYLTDNTFEFIYDGDTLSSNLTLEKTNNGTVYQIKLNKLFNVGDFINGTVFIAGHLKEFVPVLRLKSTKEDSK